ncbi:hypothetical protein DVA67_020325 [Solirubrobacter sp. CPCC 204708]|uniref:Tetratricopeptide repeat protein n=1 Tax=Solirubrobacter deserti TaxID=2282478 RepID=A0ABT4RTN0_9ACTN|nr:hypothetical protein [Solirubrobacter deserti]MBE2318339.1 hypothetical protein [Solirubrobacter deserti]MDA0141937.1 hypothetical protein [Solirubrobacter deserti]
MAENLTAAELYAKAAELFRDDQEALLELMHAQLESIEAREPNGHDAESCRLAMLAAAPVGAQVGLWRARALARFGSVGWLEGVAMMIMSDAFRQLSVVNDDYVRGRTLDRMQMSEEALQMLRELRHFTAGERRFDFGPTPALVARVLPEKSGFMLTVAGRLDEARASYERALAETKGDERGTIKVQAGLEVVGYLQALADGAQTEPFATATADLAERAAAAGQPDIARDAAHNAEVMRHRGRDLAPYEIL